MISSRPMLYVLNEPVSAHVHNDTRLQLAINEGEICSKRDGH